MNTLIMPPPMSSRPAGAQGAGLVTRMGTSIWKWLEAVGQARARRELLTLASLYATTQPELAKELRAACARTE